MKTSIDYFNGHILSLRMFFAVKWGFLESSQIVFLSFLFEINRFLLVSNSFPHTMSFVLLFIMLHIFNLGTFKWLESAVYLSPRCIQCLSLFGASNKFWIPHNHCRTNVLCLLRGTHIFCSLEVPRVLLNRVIYYLIFIGFSYSVWKKRKKTLSFIDTYEDHVNTCSPEYQKLET